MIVNKNRPVNLDISTISFPITAIVSILHRISGSVLLGGILVLIWMFDQSLASKESFIELKSLMAAPWAKLILWAILAALAYHTSAGIRHLIMDMGIGESYEGGQLGAKITLAIFIVLVVVAGVWIW